MNAVDSIASIGEEDVTDPLYGKIEGELDGVHGKHIIKTVTPITTP